MIGVDLGGTKLMAGLFDGTDKVVSRERVEVAGLDSDRLVEALSCVALFTFMHHWNDFLGPLIYLTDQQDFTLALGLHDVYRAPLGALKKAFATQDWRPQRVIALGSTSVDSKRHSPDSQERLP